MPNAAEPGQEAAGAPRRVLVDPEGPVLVEGPVEMTLDDGTVVRSDRFMVAICTCRRTKTAPWCDTSHRHREKPPKAPQAPRTGEAPQTAQTPETPETPQTPGKELP